MNVDFLQNIYPAVFFLLSLGLLMLQLCTRAAEGNLAKTVHQMTWLQCTWQCFFFFFFPSSTVELFVSQEALKSRWSQFVSQIENLYQEKVFIGSKIKSYAVFNINILLFSVWFSSLLKQKFRIWRQKSKHKWLILTVNMSDSTITQNTRSALCWPLNDD